MRLMISPLLASLPHFGLEGASPVGSRQAASRLRWCCYLTGC